MAAIARLPRVVERLAWGLGILLVAIYAGTRAWGRYQERDAMVRFERLRASVATPGTASDPSAPAPAAPGIDTSLWAPGRIQAWRESLLHDGSPALAILKIPRLGLEVPLLEGTDDATLNRGVGHVEGTAEPGATGNLAIAGHRDGFFRSLKDLVAGDHIELVTPNKRLEYVVDWLKIVRPEDVDVLDETPKSALTLITCYPFYFVGSAPQRFIARAVLAEDEGREAKGGTGAQP